MDEESRMAEAMFRYGVISDLVDGRRLARGERRALLRDKSRQQYKIPGTTRTRISLGTIKHWVRLYEAGGRRLEALYPRERKDAGVVRAWNSELSEAIIRVRKEFPLCSVPRLQLELVRRGIVGPRERICLNTLYRFLNRAGLMRAEERVPVDRRRFEAEGVNDLWQSDALHGPTVEAGGKQRKTYLLAILDDRSRLIPHGQFYLSEGIASYLDCLRQALLKRGLPRKLYVDNGSAFRSGHLEQVTAGLGIALIHSRVGEPEGRGKIERFFRTVRENFLSAIHARGLAELNTAFETWLSDWYHARQHGSTGEPPLQRFAAGLAAIRRAPADLEDCFRQAALRRVNGDRTVRLLGKLYEAPVALVGKRVSLYYHPHDCFRVEVKHNRQSYGCLRILDTHVNARSGRERKPGLLAAPEALPAPHKPRALTSGKLPLNSPAEARHE